MSRYTVLDEERIRLQAGVRGWMRAGALDASTGARLLAGLKVDLLRTGRMLRAGLALFTAGTVAAAVGLAFALFDIDSDAAILVTTALASGACVGAADGLVRRFRLYRYGIEEALAAASVLLFAISAAMLVRIASGPAHDTAALVAALLAASAASIAVYRRFGFVYAAGAATACAALIPFQFDIGHELQRLLAAGVFAWAFVPARRVRQRRGDDFPGDDAATMQAVSLIGVYVVLNVFLTPSTLGVWLGIRHKDRLLMDASLLTALGSLLTNKSYLGLARQPWDPILLGILLMVAALVVRRWLARGPGGERDGFTAARLSTSDPDALRLAGLASAGVQPAHDLGSGRPESSGFEGGRSGGAGGGAGF